jgi:hypothetical protein
MSRDLRQLVHCDLGPDAPEQFGLNGGIDDGGGNLPFRLDGLDASHRIGVDVAPTFLEGDDLDEAAFRAPWGRQERQHGLVQHNALSDGHIRVDLMQRGDACVHRHVGVDLRLENGGEFEFDRGQQHLDCQPGSQHRRAGQPAVRRSFQNHVLQAADVVQQVGALRVASDLGGMAQRVLIQDDRLVVVGGVRVTGPDQRRVERIFVDDQPGRLTKHLGLALENHVVRRDPDVCRLLVLCQPSAADFERACGADDLAGVEPAHFRRAPRLVVLAHRLAGSGIDCISPAIDLDL